MNRISDFEKYDGLALAGLVRRGEVKAIELLETVTERIESLNPKVNAQDKKLFPSLLTPHLSRLLLGHG